MGVVILKLEPADKNGNVIGSDNVHIPDPSKFNWGLQDISDQNAGRNILSDALKNLVGQARRLEFTWNGLTFETTSTLLNAFDHEYFWLTYYDALEGGYVRKHFYKGDYNAEMYSMAESSQFWQDVKINCIQAITDKV